MIYSNFVTLDPVRIADENGQIHPARSAPVA